MGVPLALNDIEICQGFMGYKRKSSMFSFQTGIVGLSAFYKNLNGWMVTKLENMS